MRKENSRGITHNWRKLVDKLLRGGGPVCVERYGEPVAVIVSWDDWVKLNVDAQNGTNQNEEAGE